jgi:hypothetical protein
MMQQFRVLRPVDAQPRKLFAIGSEKSKATTEAFGWLDSVLLYSDDPVFTLKEKAGLDKDSRVVIFDFGGRKAAAFEWASKLKDEAKKLTVITIGSSPETDGGLINYEQQLGVQHAIGNTMGIRNGAMENHGAKRYWEEFEAAWAKFKNDGGLPGIEFDISNGLDAVKQGWDDLAAGTIPGTKALLYSI